MAPPMRFTEPQRTSPMAKTPGALVSNGRGDVFAARPDQFLEREVDPRLHETLPIERNVAAPEPLGRRIGAHEEEDVPDVRLVLESCALVLPPDLLQLRPFVPP